METIEITNYDDVIDSRDVIARIEALESDLTDAFEEVSRERFLELEGELESALVEEYPEEDEGVPASGTPSLFEFASAQAAQDGPLSAEAEQYLVMLPQPLREDLDSFLEAVAASTDHTLYDEANEYLALKSLADEAEGYGDWSYGETLVRDSYFREYAEMLAYDIGAVNGDARWPNDCIDWERAASELQVDYTSVDYGGVTYWLRS